MRRSRSGNLSKKTPLAPQGASIDLSQRMGLQDRAHLRGLQRSVDRNHPAQSAGDHVSRLPAGAKTNRVSAVGKRDGALRKFIVQIERAEHDVWRELPINAGADDIAKPGIAG